MDTVPEYLAAAFVPMVVAFMVLILAEQVVPALVRQRSLGLPGLDGIRVEGAALRYNLWLSWLGATGNLRRALVAGLRADLCESARDAGGRAAVRRLGSLRRLAREAAAAEDERYRRPRWGLAVILGGLAAGLVALLQTLMAVAWWNAAEASGAGRVVGSLPLFPDSSISWSRAGGVDLSTGIAFPAVFFGIFLLSARPWRLLRRRPPA